MAHTDKYRDYDDLVRHEQLGVTFDYQVTNRHSELVVLAPHGGGIEPGTSELARAIAGSNYSLYLFEGLKSANNFDLHISSHRFDAPGCRALSQAAQVVLTIHGEGSAHPVVFVGGRDQSFLARMQDRLRSAGFTVRRHANPELQGEHPDNICNIGRSRAGVQLEISLGLRTLLFASLTRAGRQQPTPLFHDFVSAVRFCCQSVLQETASGSPRTSS